jgi:signal transduction histidine kinase
MTITQKLARLFSALVAILLIGFALLSYSLVRSRAQTDFQEKLHTRAMTAALVVLEADEKDSITVIAARKRLSSFRLDQEHISVIGPGRRILYSTDALPHTIEDKHIDQALKGNAYSEYQNYQAILCFPYDDNNQRYIITASAVDKTAPDTLYSLVLSLLTGITLSMGFIYFIGLYFARRAMEPVDTMRQQAEEMSARDLHLRLPGQDESDELGRLAHAFNGLFIRLESAFNSQKSFVAHASHELRTPLTIIEGQIEVALMKLRSGLEYETVLRTVLDQVKSLKSLTTNLLMLARAESVLSALPARIVQFDEILLQSIEHCSILWPGRTIEIAFGEIPETAEAFAIKGSKELLQSALENLLDNALKYSPAYTKVHVQLSSENGFILCSICDEGPGISAEEQKRVLEPFYRSDQTAGKPGTGIGLALVKTVIQRHSGTVHIGNNPAGNGACIQLSLPVYSN